MLTGTAISDIGNALSGLAVPWFVLQTTGSAYLTGLTAFAGMLPLVFGGLIGGAVVDRLGHKRVSVLSDLASGIAVALIPILHQTVGIAFWQLIVLVFLGTLFDSPGRTARGALAPTLAERAQTSLERVNSMNQMIGSMAMLLGPPLAGVLIALVGSSNVLWIDAASFGVSAAFVVFFVPAGKPTESKTTTGIRKDIEIGLRFIASDALLRAILWPAIVVNFLAAPLFAVVVPVFASNTYGEPVDFGVMLAGFGGGMMVGSLAYGAVASRIPKRRIFVLGLVAGGFPIWLLALQPRVEIAATLLALSGIALAPLNPIEMTAIQRRTPVALLGRVIGALSAISTLFAPLGMLVAGTSLEWIGLRGTLLGIAAGLFAVAIYVVHDSGFAEFD